MKFSKVFLIIVTFVIFVLAAWTTLLVLASLFALSCVLSSNGCASVRALATLSSFTLWIFFCYLFLKIKYYNLIPSDIKTKFLKAFKIIVALYVLFFSFLFLIYRHF